MKGWRTKRGAHALGVGQEAGIDHRHPAEDDLAERALIDPALQRPVPRPEAPVLVRPSAAPCRRAGGPAPRTRRGSASCGFWHSTSMPRAAAASTQSAWVSRGEATSSASIASRGEHRLAIPVDLGDAELGGALAGALGIGIADRDELHRARRDCASATRWYQLIIPAPSDGHLERCLAARNPGHEARPPFVLVRHGR